MGGIGAGNGVLFHLFQLTAEGADGLGGLLQLFLGGGALQCSEHTAHFGHGQAELAQGVQPSHSPGGDHVEAAADVGNFLHPTGDAADVGEVQFFANLLLEGDALLQAVQQRDLTSGRKNFQHQTGETGTGAHVQQTLAIQRHIAQQRGAIEEVQPGGVLFPFNGSEVHHLIALGEIFIISPELIRGVFGNGQTHLGKTLSQNRFHSYLLRSSGAAGKTVAAAGTGDLNFTLTPGYPEPVAAAGAVEELIFLPVPKPLPPCPGIGAEALKS